MQRSVQVLLPGKGTCDGSSRSETEALLPGAAILCHETSVAERFCAQTGRKWTRKQHNRTKHQSQTEDFGILVLWGRRSALWETGSITTGSERSWNRSRLMRFKSSFPFAAALRLSSEPSPRFPQKSTQARGAFPFMSLQQFPSDRAGSSSSSQG